MISLDHAQISFLVFIIFSIPQALAFIFYPETFLDMLGQYDQTPFPCLRAIGVKELGLMSMYTAALVSNDRLFMTFTVVARLFFVSIYNIYIVLVLGAPPIIFLGMIQDYIFGTWTAYALTRSESHLPNHKRYIRRLASSHSWVPETIVRVLIFRMGLIDLNQFGVLLKGASAESSDSVGSVLTLAHHSSFNFALGIASVGLIGCFVSAYQILLAINRAPIAVYLAIGFNYVLIAFLFDNLAAITSIPSLSTYYRSQRTHTESGLFILAATIILSGWDAAGVKGKKTSKQD